MLSKTENKNMKNNNDTFIVPIKRKMKNQMSVFLHFDYHQNCFSIILLKPLTIYKRLRNYVITPKKMMQL